MDNENSLTVTLRVINLKQAAASRQKSAVLKFRVMVPRLLILLVVLGVGLALASLVIAAVSRGNWPVWVLRSGLILIIALMLVPVTERLVEIRDEHLYKPEGEEALLATLKPFFDPRWALLQNVPLAGNGKVIDAILVGPTGLYLIEICGHPGYNLVKGEKWFRWRWGIWFPVFTNPTEQIRRKSEALKRALAAAEIDATAELRVVWVGPGQLNLQEPSVEVWKLADIELAIEALKRFKLLPQNQVEAIVRCLAGASGSGSGRTTAQPD
ncbi:MAG: nuclease-related domain-containing protein [Anaerolineae bacterium]